MGWFDFLTRRAAPGAGVVVALGGGGARGLAHVGVLEVLEEAGVPLAGVAGTSAGAVVGAMWLALGGAAGVVRRWREFIEAGIVRELPDTRLAENVSTRDNPILHFARKVRNGAFVALALERTSLVTHAQLEHALAFLLPDVPIESLPLPFAAIATDFETGRPVVLHSGRLLRALAASCAIPAVVPPVPVGGVYLVDGGTVADVPVAQAGLLADRPVVAVDTGEGWRAEDPATITLPRALLRGANMTHRALRERLISDADLVLRPAVSGAHWSEFHRFEELRAAGRSAALQHVHRLRALSAGPRRRTAARSEA